MQSVKLAEAGGHVMLAIGITDHFLLERLVESQSLLSMTWRVRTALCHEHARRTDNTEARTTRGYLLKPISNTGKC